MDSKTSEATDAKSFADQVYFKGEEISQNTPYDGTFGNWMVNGDEERSPSSNKQQQGSKQKPKEFKSDIEKCADRIQTACTNLSGNNENRIEENAESCKSIQNHKTGSIIEILQLKQADKIILVKTKGAGITNGHALLAG